MKSLVRIHQQGIAHVGLVLLLAVVLGGVGFAGYRVFSKNKDNPAQINKSSKTNHGAGCTEPDKNICTFISRWKANKYYTVVSKTTAEGVTTESTYKAEGDKKFHLIATGSTPYEMIVIDGATYTKAADGTWWKQAAKPEDATRYTKSFDPAADKTIYKKLGTESCALLTCYKYQAVSSPSPDDKEYIWFDIKDHQLRKTRSETKDGTISESTFNYDRVSITVPNPVKELGPSQIMMPGASEPTTMPEAGSLQDYQSSLPTSVEE